MNTEIKPNGAMRMETRNVLRSKKTQPSLLGTIGLVATIFMSIPIAHAQDCTNPAATPHVCAFDSVKHAQAGTKLKGVLLLDWRNGGHDRGPTQRSMMRLAQKYGFRLDRSESQSYINDSTLRGIDIIVFNNSDQDPIPGAIQLNAVRKFVEVQGKAVLAIHAAGAYIPCPNEDITLETCRWMMRGLRTQFWIMNNDNAKVTIFADSVRTDEIPPRATNVSSVPSARNHGRMHSESRMIFEGLPTNAGAGPNANRPYVWEGLGDEWYNYRNNPRLEGERVIQGVNYGPINILLSLDESSFASNNTCAGGTNNCNNQGTFGDRPVSWTRKVGNGLFAYQNAGHSDVYVRARTVGGVTVQDSLIEKYNWRLMKYLARDFVGCMDPSDPNYNPQASVERLTESDPEKPCQNVSSIRTSGARPSSRIMTLKQITGSLQIQVHSPKGTRIMVHDAAGILKWVGFAKDAETLKIHPLRPGNYFVHAYNSSLRETQRVLVR